MTKTLYLIPKHPNPQLSEAGDILYWICSECDMTYPTEQEAFDCCRIIWPIDFDVDKNPAC